MNAYLRLAAAGIFALLPLMLLSVAGACIGVWLLRPSHVKTFVALPILAAVFGTVVLASFFYQMLTSYRYDREGYRFVLAQRVHMRSPEHKLAYARVRDALEGVSAGLGVASPQSVCPGHTRAQRHRLRGRARVHLRRGHHGDADHAPEPL